MMSSVKEQSIWIGVDVGTTGVRAIAYEASGVSRAAAEAFYPLRTPHPDRAEERPSEIRAATEQVVRKVADALRHQGRIPSGIALSTVMHSLIPLDAAKAPLADMQTWADSRSAGIVRELKENESALCRAFYERTGCPMHACYPLAKILWLKQNRPELFARTKFIGSIKDHLFHAFTGEFLIDRSTASTTALYNAHQLAWDAEILNFIGITEEMLPPVVSTTEMRPLTAAAAERMHLTAGLPVVIGATDGVLVNVGIGAVAAGQLSATIGTSGAVRMLVGEPRTDDAMRTWCYNLVDGLWVAGGAINNGGMILRWMRDKICHFSEAQMAALDVDAYDLMTMKAAKIPAGSDGLILLPFFTGERAPYWNSDLRGMFFGLSLNHSRSHMIRAVMEGICYGMHSVFDALQGFGAVRDIRMSGSFTKSPLWMQILADVLGEPLVLPSNSEGAAYGAAVLGFISAGEMKGIADTAALVHAKKVYTPDAENHKTYAQLADISGRLYRNLQKEFAEIAAYQAGR